VNTAGTDVAGSTWITEKTTTEGAYRAEIQQVVPAPLSAEVQARLMAAGQHMAALVSANNGAWHNEVFLGSDHLTSAVETNMRPGGMHIWDLAREAFIDFDPWERWVRWAVEGRVATMNQYRAAIAAFACCARRPAAFCVRCAGHPVRWPRSLNIELVEASYASASVIRSPRWCKTTPRSSATSCCSTSDYGSSVTTCCDWPRPSNQGSDRSLAPRWGLVPVEGSMFLVLIKRVR
jgi:hypothetical protein